MLPGLCTSVGAPRARVACSCTLTHDICDSMELRGAWTFFFFLLYILLFGL